MLPMMQAKQEFMAWFTPVLLRDLRTGFATTLESEGATRFEVDLQTVSLDRLAS
jgi:hypothetical protein